MNNQKKLVYGSVCSGVEAATVAWHSLGWTPAWFSEIEDFPCAVLNHHYPNIPNLGDMTKLENNSIYNDTNINVLVGGTPCQSFSFAGLRAGLDDPRGDLMLTFAKIAATKRPEWVVWENVPGVLSSNSGKDFGTFLGLLTGRHVKPPKNGWQNFGYIDGYKNAYGICWRVLNARYFGVAQRRQRVFVIGYLGNWRAAAAVLLESYSLRGNPPPSKKAGEAASTAIGGGAKNGSESEESPIVIDRGAFNQGINAKFTSLIKESESIPTLVGRGPHVVMDKGGSWPSEVADALTANMGDKQDLDNQHAFGGSRFVPVAQFWDGGQISNALTAGGTSDRMPDKNRMPVVLVPIVNEETLIPFDTTQITSPLNFSNPKDGDPMHPLAKTQHPPAIAYSISFNDVNGKRKDMPEGGLYVRRVENGIVPALNTNESNVVVLDKQPLMFKVRTEGFYDGTKGGEIKKGSGGSGILVKEQEAFTIATTHDQYLQYKMAVRRLTPLECERLQGFPDNYTRIPYKNKPADKCPDGPRYRAMGNSMAVPVMEWIGKRIQMVEDILQELENK